MAVITQKSKLFAIGLTLLFFFTFLLIFTVLNSAKLPAMINDNNSPGERLLRKNEDDLVYHRESGNFNNAAIEELKESSFDKLHIFDPTDESYGNITFCTIMSSKVNEYMELLRGFVGGIHQIRDGKDNAPQIVIFVQDKLEENELEEISWWNKVKVIEVSSLLGLPISNSLLENVDSENVKDLLFEQMSEKYPTVMWIKFGYVIDPQRIPIYRTEKEGSALKLLKLYEEGRNVVMNIFNLPAIKNQISLKGEREPRYSNNVKISDSGSNKIENLGMYDSGSEIIRIYSIWFKKELKTIDSNTVANAESFGVFPYDPYSQLRCIAEIDEKKLLNSIVLNSVHETKTTELYRIATLDTLNKHVALGVPTTSKGASSDENPVFITALLRSFIDTITPEEFSTHRFTIYVGFDHGDAYYDDKQKRTFFIESAQEMIGSLPIKIKMYQLPRIKRVAAIWNILFLQALREKLDYFYQVNDDLTMETVGWLTWFTHQLDKNNGFGVVGPADNHNGFNCKLLTQAMVTPVHYEIFGTLYPLEVKDWKSDRWLTFVYDASDVNCDKNIIANNGAAVTRYKHCEFLSWVIYLEEGQKQIKKWKNNSL